MELFVFHLLKQSNRSPRRNEERDKSSKRKSNLNRALNEEATPDGGKLIGNKQINKYEINNLVQRNLLEM